VLVTPDLQSQLIALPLLKHRLFHVLAKTLSFRFLPLNVFTSSSIHLGAFISLIERMHSRARVLRHSENLTYYTVSRSLNSIDTGDFRGTAIAFHSLGKRGTACGRAFLAA
jgi:hypothetical protein